MIPSLGIILTEKCNFKCAYCPPFGENMAKTEIGLCNIASLLNLIEIASKYDVKVVRFTGGEPFLLPKRVHELLAQACKYNFSKIILNTNGFTLSEHIHWLKEYKDKFLLKISLDTLNPETFNKIIQVPNLQHDKVLKGIELAVNEQFNIEINAVANKYNIDELMDIIKYCQSNKLNLKIFDLFDFGGTIENFDDIKVDIDSFLSKIRNEFECLEDERLPGDRGIEMHKYKLTDTNHLLIVSHEGKNSSSKYYTDSCKNCQYYPCNTGKFQIPIRADGLMQSCRIAPDGIIDRINISKLNYEEVEVAFLKILEDFEDEFIN